MISVKAINDGVTFVVTTPSDVQVECKNNYDIIHYFHFTPQEAREFAAALVVCAEQVELSKK